jgi:hypothetical protein
MMEIHATRQHSLSLLFCEEWHFAEHIDPNFMKVTEKLKWAINSKYIFPLYHHGFNL